MQFNVPVVKSTTFAEDLFSDNPQVNDTLIEEQEEDIKVQDTKLETPVIDINLDTEEDDDIEEPESEVYEENEFEKAIRSLYEKGLVKELPSDVKNIDSLETYNKVLEHNQALLNQEVAESVYEDLNEKLSPLAKQIFIFDLDSKNAGGDLETFIKSLLFVADTSNLDEEDPLDQEEIILQYLQSTNVPESEIQELIELYKNDPNVLKTKAAKFKPLLVEMSRKEAEKHIEQQKLIENEEDSQKTNLTNKLVNQLKTGKLGTISNNSDEIPLNEADAQWLFKASLDTKIQQKIKGKNVEMGMFEALGHFHKYNKDGNINLYMTAMLLLKDPDKVIEHFKKIVKKDIIKETRSENSFGNTGLVFSKKKVEPKVIKKEKTAFDLKGLF